VGAYQAAERDFTRVLRQRPSDLEALFDRGLVWLALGRLDLAQADLRAAQNGFRVAGQPEMAQRIEHLLRHIAQRGAPVPGADAPLPLIKGAYVSAGLG
jgi:tetratricopeptide (TPR) repeat protein